MKPQRIQLRRAKGWRLPENTVVVSRPGPWGNPFVVGRDGPASKCVELYALLMQGYMAVTTGATCEEMQKARAHVREHLHELVGKNLACWCKPGKPCHADILLEGAWNLTAKGPKAP